MHSACPTLLFKTRPRRCYLNEDQETDDQDRDKSPDKIVSLAVIVLANGMVPVNAI